MNIIEFPSPDSTPKVTFSAPQDAPALVAQAVAQSIKAGATLEMAAEDAGTTVEAVLADSKGREALRAIVAEYTATAKELQAAVPAGLLKEALSADDSRDRTNAWKALAAMPQVGLSGGGLKVEAGGMWDEDTKAFAMKITLEGE